MRRIAFPALVAASLGLGLPSCTAAQQDFLEVGAMAPDFEIAGATRHGVLAEPVKLSDYRGETVVLAFFFRVRTPG